jgi:hypothetical protein
LSVHNLEWMRRKLLNYREQVTSLLGADIEVLSSPVSDKAIFGWRTLADSKFLGMDLSISRDVRFTFRWRNFKAARRETIQITMEKKEGIQKLLDNGFAPTLGLGVRSVETAEPLLHGLKLKVSYYPDCSVKMLDSFGLNQEVKSDGHED